jgi:hypothetical protein
MSRICTEEIIMSTQPGLFPGPHSERPRDDGWTNEFHQQGLKFYCRPETGQGESGWWQGRALEVSMGGMGLLLGRRFEPGTVLTVDVESLAAAFSSRVQVRVIQAIPRPPGCWFLGCVFAQGLDPEERLALLLVHGGVRSPAARG